MATTEIYTLSLHDALPIWLMYRFHYGADVEFVCVDTSRQSWLFGDRFFEHKNHASFLDRSEEHTSELQSRLHLVCRLLLEKKKKKTKIKFIITIKYYMLHK